MWDRSSIKYEIYQRLNKSPATKGFYTDDKANSAIQESLDYMATEMCLYDEGFLKDIDYFDIEANQVTVPIPPHIEMIVQVRYLVGSIYVPLSYSSNFDSPEWSLASGATNLPSTYRIVGNNFYFNPPLGVGGSKVLQCEFMRYPSILRHDSQQIDSQFGRACMYFCIYRSATIMAQAMGQMNVPWHDSEILWYQRSLALIQKRTLESVPIRDFAGW